MSESAAEQENGHKKAAPKGKYLAKLCLASLGVVYGDIGTSPLYAIRECFNGEHAVTMTGDNVLGVLSLVFWALMIVISFKYLGYVTRADNRGEGGILALMALASRGKSRTKLTGVLITMLGLFGASLLYGDGMITPAISVLGAMDGLAVAAPSLGRFVVPATICILVGLFLVQKKGTGRIGVIFGPFNMIWFSVLGVMGLRQILENPGVLRAVIPAYGISFFIHNQLHGFVILGAVFLVVTGGEALYADMGHLGAKPIRLTWFVLVLPALLLNYFGQGALLLNYPEAVSNPFYRMAPSWALIPLLVLATGATIIASQAVISGAFSLTRQASMLGYLPRMRILHTSSTEIGQIYVPAINWILMFSTIGLVLGFGSSSKLAAAYGVAVTTDMVITTLLACVVAQRLWGWGKLRSLGLTAGLLMVDLAFFASNIVKVPQGGWFPLVIAASVFLVMTTWRKGRMLLGRQIKDGIVPLDDFFEIMNVEPMRRVPGAAVFMTSNSQGTPPALMNNFLHNHVVHDKVILLTILTEEVPYVEASRRVTVESLKEGFVRIVARYGFMENPDVVSLLASPETPSLPLEYTTFFLGNETVLAENRNKMLRWRTGIFSFLSRNAVRPTAFFNIPSRRIMELGSQISL